MHTFLSVLFTLALITQDVRSDDDLKPIVEDLTETEVAALVKGEQVVHTEEMPDSAWPRGWVYQYAPDATPEELTAVFTDYPDAINYLPRMLRAEVVKELSPTRKWVAYEINLPWPLKNSKYTTDDVLSYVADLEEYRVDWTQVTSNSTSRTTGYMRASAMPDHPGTLFVMHNDVVPTSSMAGIAGNQAAKEQMAVVEETIKRVAYFKDKDPKHLDEQVLRLRDELGQ
ncbi:MAG: hypothetical protein AAB425_01130 [Bdellovibrionota bacterium]